jgi:hypothetical protein
MEERDIDNGTPPENGAATAPPIGFTQPDPAVGEHLIRVVLDPRSKKWGFFEAPPAVAVAKDVDDAPGVPADQEYPFDDQIEAVNAALRARASAGNQFTTVRDPRSGRWGFHEIPHVAHPVDAAAVPDGVQFPFNTVSEATVGAVNYAAGEPVAVHGGVAVSSMPANARIIGSPGYRARIDGGLYDLDQDELRAVYEQTHRKSGEQARQTAIRYDIPIGQQASAFIELHRRMPRRDRPKLHDWLNERMPGMNKRTRQRHFKCFAIVSSYDWPDMVAQAGEEITGMASILRVARAFSPPPPRKKKTPLKERYLTLRNTVASQRYAEAQQLIEQYDSEDVAVS